MILIKLSKAMVQCSVSSVKSGPFAFSYYDGIGWISKWFINTSDGFDWLYAKLPDLTLEETLQLIKYKNDII